MQVQSEDKPYDDINITPMLDLAYVLLVIFILMCTASVAGLAVAIPALFGYNYLNSRIGELNADMQVFVDEFITRIAENHSV